MYHSYARTREGPTVEIAKKQESHVAPKTNESDDFNNILLPYWMMNNTHSIYQTPEEEGKGGSNRGHEIASTQADEQRHGSEQGWNDDYGSGGYNDGGGYGGWSGGDY